VAEKDIQREILDFLLAHPKVTLVFQNDHRNQRARKFGAVGKYRPKGLPDIIGCLSNGQFLAIEVKDTLGRVSEEQCGILRRISDGGGLAGVCRSIEDASRLLG